MTDLLHAISAFALGSGAAALIIAVHEYRHRPRVRKTVDAAGCRRVLTTYTKGGRS